MIRVALVGYTNVGKSTLLNLLAKSEVFAENKLFATLDTTVRKVVIENLPFLLSDTVGFIRKLPTDLVESFKSTLDEVREADLLLHVVDISHPDFEEQLQVVEKTLSDLGCADTPTVIVFNKTDAYQWVEKEADDLTPPTRENVSLPELMRTWMARLGDDCIFISARERINIDELKDLMYKRVRELHVQKYPYNDFLYQHYDADGREVASPTPELDELSTRSFPQFEERPSDFIMQNRDWAYNSVADRIRFVRHHPDLSEQMLRKYSYDTWSQLLAPLACLVITLFAIPAGIASGRQSVFKGIVGALLMFFAFYGLVIGCMVGSDIGWLPPILAAVLPHAVFLAIGGWLFYRQR